MRSANGVVFKCDGDSSTAQGRNAPPVFQLVARKSQIPAAPPPGQISATPPTPFPPPPVSCNLSPNMDQPPPFLVLRPAPPAPTFAPLEVAEQTALVRWLRSRGIPHHSVPNSAASSRQRGAALKREGLVAGVPDLFIYPPGGPLLALELKRANGTLSDLSPGQVEWLTLLSRYPGVVAAVSFGWEPARDYLCANYTL